MTRFEIWFLSLLMVSLWALMPATQLWDWDEAHYARTGIEMWEAGNLLLPQFNGELYGHKPPFAFWLMGLAVQIFGETEFAARFFSAPALAIAAFLTGRTATLMFDRKVGEASMVIFATGFLSIYLGAAAMLDAYLVVGCALSVWAVVKIVQDRQVTWGLWIWFTLGGLLTLLVKGPVGPTLIGGMALGIWVFLPKDERPDWKAFWLLVAGGIVGILGFLAWFIPANTSSGGDLAGQVIGVHIIGRALAPMEGHGGQGVLGFLLFLPVYIPVILLGMLPWTTYLPASLTHTIRRVDRKNRVILLSWAVPLFVAFSAVATKLPHYIFPVLAPLAVMIAAYLIGDKRGSRYAGRRISALLYLAIAAALLWAGFALGQGLSQFLPILAALGFLAMAALVWRLPADHSALVPLAIASIASMQLLYWGGLREIEGHVKLSRTLGTAIQKHVPGTAPIFMGYYREPSLSFYASRDIDQPIRPLRASNLAEILADVPNGYGVFTEREKQVLEKAFPKRTVAVLGLASGRNFNQDGVLQNVYLLEWRDVAE